MIIQKATVHHLPSITAIYNHAIEHSVATFDTELKTIDDRKTWLDEHGDNYPVLVALINDEVAGWASLSKWSPRAAYNGTVEISIYFAAQSQGKGYGNGLMKALLEAGKKAGLHTIIARISEGNEVSIYLHKKYGFVPTGTLKEVGYKFNRYVDVHMMQLML
ncbi:MAG: N-acetyltransferase family protein [Bacteroidota bacterium]